MESWIQTLSNRDTPWIQTLLDNPDYVVWMPPYWQTESLDTLGRLFIEPEYSEGKLYANKSEPQSPWFYSLRGSNTKPLS